MWVGLEVVRVVPGVLWGHRGNRMCVGGEDLANNSVAVHGEVECLADADVVQEISVAVDEARHDAHGVDGHEVGVLRAIDADRVVG